MATRSRSGSPLMPRCKPRPSWGKSCLASAAFAFAPDLFSAESTRHAEQVTTRFQLIDWTIVIVYGAILLAIGFYFARKQKTTEEYFLAGRKTGPFTAGISLFATLLSTITFVAMPGEMVQNGPVVAGLYIAALPITYLLVGWLVIPAVMRLRVSSAYELLEAKLGRRIRILGSLTFVLTRLVWMALLLYTTSNVLVNVMGWDPAWITLITILTGFVTIVYTLSGGIGAVMVTDVLQSFVLLLAAVLAFLCITNAMGGLSAIWPNEWVTHWAPQPFFSIDPHVRVTMVGTFIGTIIFWVCTSSSDQIAVQRYLTTRDAATARRAFLLSNIADAIVTTVLTLVGVALLAFYRSGTGVLPKNLSIERNGDALFAHYIGHYLPAGVSGLVVSGLLAAAMSSLSSGLNSIIASVSKDILETQFPTLNQSESSKVRTARLLALAIGTVTVLLSIGVAHVPGNLVEVSNKTASLLVCPIFGLFFLAMYVPFATPFGAAIGALYSFTAAATVSYWDLLTGQPGLSFQWIAPVALLVGIVSGCGFSLLPTRNASREMLFAYSMGAILPLVAVVSLLRG